MLSENGVQLVVEHLVFERLFEGNPDAFEDLAAIFNKRWFVEDQPAPSCGVG